VSVAKLAGYNETLMGEIEAWLAKAMAGLGEVRKTGHYAY